MKELFDSAFDILNRRTAWEQDQRMYYEMRHRGLSRAIKPFPGCADGHVPIIDNAIRKNKPFWLGQLTAGDRLCNFTALKNQLGNLSDAAASYYDFETRQRSKFLDEMDAVCDTMLLRGRGVIKCTIDPFNEYRLVDEAVDPMFILMSDEFDDFDDADEFVHVRKMTKAAYKRLDQRWDTSPDTLKKICGSADFANFSTTVQQKQIREGITHSSRENQILIWEHWVRNGRGHTIYTYSPQAPEIPLRQPHGNPYKVNGKSSCPYFSFPMESKDKGWYSPRGLGELLAAWEMFATKIVNEKADYMTFVNRPVFTGDKEIVNSANLRWSPGEYIPGNVRGVQHATPPMSFEEFLGFAREMAEEASQSPDFGITQDGQANGSKRTATENNRIASLQQTGSNYNGEIFRRRLARVHRHRWGMVCQFKERDFSFYAAEELNSLPEEALHDQYLVEPDGSPDGWNRLARFQRALAALQSFQGNPNVDPEPLTKEALTAWDGRMAVKAFVPTGLKAQTEYEAQATEILLLTATPPFPCQPLPNQDQMTRIKCIVDWMHAAAAVGKPVNPQARQLVQQNMAARIKILQQQNPAAAKQIVEMIKQMETAPMAPAGGGAAPPGAGTPSGGAIPPANGAPPMGRVM